MTLLNLDSNITLLTGPPASGKTSLLFNHAVQELVANRNKNVWMVCQRKLDKIPAYVDLPEDSSLLKNLSFYYVNDRTEFRRLIVSKLPKEAPTILLVDSINRYYTDLPDLYQTLKVLEHSLNFLRHTQGVVCQVVLSTSTASVASFNQATLAELVPARVQILPKTKPGSSEKFFSVQDTDFEFYRDMDNGFQRIRVLSVS